MALSTDISFKRVSPLLVPNLTKEELHNRIISQICPSCELEGFKQMPKQLINYSWTARHYREIELFPPVDAQDFNTCIHHRMLNEQS